VFPVTYEPPAQACLDRGNEREIEKKVQYLSLNLFVCVMLMIAAPLSAGSADQPAAWPPVRPHGGLRVALAQIPVEDGHLKHNMRLAEEAAHEAAGQKADMLNLPEASDWGWLYQQARRDALPIPGKYTDFLAQLARRYRMWVSAGCLEKAGDKVYNSAVIIDRTGRLVLKHRKIDTLAWLTKDLYDQGCSEDIKTIDTEFGRIGLTICADNFTLKNPRHAADQGAWLLIAPHGFAAEPDKLEQNAKDYQKHIRKVAAKTGLWVVGTDAVLGKVQGGQWKGRLHSGCSLVARPDGTAAIVAKFKEPDLVVFDIPAEP
jgi:predicted amidohydrolase